MITVRNRFISCCIPPQGILILCIMIGIAFALFYFSLATGKSVLSLGAVWDALQGQGKALNKILVNTLRMPRTAVSFMAGGMLAMAGYLMQSATKNPLASPTLTGVADGASLGAVFFLAVYSDAQGNMLAQYQYLPIFALVFGFAVLGGVMGIHSVLRGGNTTFILIGITVAIICKALSSLLMMVSPIYRANQAAVWLSGSVDSATINTVYTMVPFFGIMLGSTLVLGHILKIMVLSPATVDSIGGHDRGYKTILIILAGGITAIAVSFAGPIGFVGILAPHMVRKMSPDSQGTLQALQVLMLGGILVLGGDYLGRMIIAPLQIPVGIMTSVLGGIAFLIFFYKKRKHT